MLQFDRNTSSGCNNPNYGLLLWYVPELYQFEKSLCEGRLYNSMLFYVPRLHEWRHIYIILWWCCKLFNGMRSHELASRRLRIILAERQKSWQGTHPVRILNAGIAEIRAIVLFLLCELLVELEEFGYALAFGHGLDGEAVCRHNCTVVVLMGTT